MFKKLFTATMSLLLSLLILTSCSFSIADNSGFSGNNGTSSGDYKTASLISQLLDTYSYYDYTGKMDDETVSKSLVSYYAQTTGDIYAWYYNAEEFKALQAENVGESQGIGINIIEDTEHNCIEVITVQPDSPALEAGIQTGDLIVQVGIGEAAVEVSSLGYEAAVKRLQGVKDTVCEFGVVRNGDFDNIIEYSIMRSTFVSKSVMYTVSATDAKVGIIKLLGFDLTTPTGFTEAMDSLIASGCTDFVFDVRYNPGGDLASIQAVLSYLLKEGDTVIITTTAGGEESITYCAPISYADKAYQTCSITSTDIGKYRNENYEYAVLMNGSTASAAELFTGTLKAYDIATVVGTTSYGKGCMQSIIPLSNFGAEYTGAIKMTTKYYRPYNSENYQGIGISPSDGYTVELSEEASDYNIYKLFEAELQSKDNQLQAAIASFAD